MLSLDIFSFTKLQFWTQSWKLQAYTVQEGKRAVNDTFCLERKKESKKEIKKENMST